MTELFKPNIYDRFQCIGHACTLTCCQEWKISVDEDTWNRWLTMDREKHVFSRLRGSSDEISISPENVTAGDSNQRQIRLGDDHHCPLLDERGLCRLVLTAGDSALSKTCAEFPRQFRREGSRLEAGLMTGCPHVMELLMEAEALVIPGDEDLETLPPLKSGNLSPECLHFLRRCARKSLASDSYLVETTLMALFYLLSEINQEEGNPKELLSLFSTISQVDNWNSLIRHIEKMDFSPLDTWQECNELFLDLAENYRKEDRYPDFLEPICSMAEELEFILEEPEYTCQVTPEILEDFLNYWRSLHGMARRWLEAECWNSLLPEDADLESLLMNFQWMTMGLTAIRQSILLQWLMKDGEPLSPEELQLSFSILSRMTGYEDDDIREYLEMSFDDLIWDWGYLALILGDGSSDFS